MSDWEEALRTRCTDDPAVLLAATGVDWSRRKQGSGMPRLVLQMVSDEHPQNLKGLQTMRPSRVQFDCYGETRRQVQALRAATIAAVVGAGVFSGVQFGRAMIEPVRDLGSQTDTGFVHRDSFDAIIWHE